MPPKNQGKLDAVNTDTGIWSIQNGGSGGHRSLADRRRPYGGLTPATITQVVEVKTGKCACGKRLLGGSGVCSECATSSTPVFVEHPVVKLPVNVQGVFNAAHLLQGRRKALKAPTS